MANTIFQTSKKLALYRIILTTAFILLACVLTQSAHAGYFHYMGGYKNSIVVWRDQVYMASVDIIYVGSSDPNVFSDVVLFQPSNYYTDFNVPDQSILHIDFVPPINYDPCVPELDITTFTTVVDWGFPGSPSPFTFVEYDPNGQIVGQGSITNVTSDPTDIPVLNYWGVAAIAILLGTIGILMIKWQHIKKAI
jgi:hypothetical protein